MNIFKILLTITLILKISSAAKETTSKRYKLLEFALPKHKNAVRIFLMLQEPWHLNVLLELNQLIENDNEAYTPLYEVYRHSIENVLDAFKAYAEDQLNCENAERLLDAIGSTRDILFASEDEAFKKILNNISLDTLDVYEYYTLEFYDRFVEEFQHFSNSLRKEEEQNEQGLFKWFEEFQNEMDFMEKTEKFAEFFQFFQSELKYDTTVCKCLL